MRINVKQKLIIMATFKYEKTVYQYSFNPPTSIAEDDFNALKLQTLLNPYQAIFKEENPNKDLNRIDLILGIGIVAGIIGLIGILGNDSKPGWAIILMMISVFLVVGPILNGGIRESEQNRAKAEAKKQAYFKDLEHMVRRAESYQEFRMACNRKYGARFYMN